MSIRVICAVLILVASLSCSRKTLEPIEPPPPPPPVSRTERPQTPRPVPPPDSGPLASAEARAVLAELEGRRFTDGDGVLGGGEWTVATFSVSPYHDGNVWKTGPHITLTQGAKSADLPVEADGDVADLFRRVTGETHPKLRSEMSEAYKAAIGRADG